MLEASFLSSESMRHLTPEGARETFHIMESEWNITAIVGDVGCFEEVVPYTQSKPEVHTIGMFARKVAGVMPDVHLRVVEEKLQRSKWNSDVGVVEVACNDCEKMNNQKVVNTETNQSKRDILQDSIHHILHPVIAQVSRKPHFFHGVVNFMEFPEPRNSVKKTVHIPVYKVSENKEEEKLPPNGPLTYVKGDQVVDADKGE